MRTTLLLAGSLSLACHEVPPKRASSASESHASREPQKSTDPSVQDPGANPDRDPALAKQWVEEEGAILLDVRSRDEWDAGHLDGATHIPVGELEGRLQELTTLAEGDQRKPIVVYCRSGRRAGRAKQLLLDAGYQRVTNLGGMRDWPEEAGE